MPPGLRIEVGSCLLNISLYVVCLPAGSSFVSPPLVLHRGSCFLACKIRFRFTNDGLYERLKKCRTFK